MGLKMPCSSCGSRKRNHNCVRCTERMIATSSTDERRHRFMSDEAVRLTIKLPTLRPSMDLSSPISVALIGCGKPRARMSQLQSGLPAYQLYRGQLFKAAYEYAWNYFDDVMILSALHGVVSPFHKIQPYNLRMTMLLESERYAWGRRVVGDLLTLYPLKRLQIAMLCGHQYVQPILRARDKEIPAPQWEIVVPLDGLGLWERFRWFKDNSENTELVGIG